MQLFGPHHHIDKMTWNLCTQGSYKEEAQRCLKLSFKRGEKIIERDLSRPLIKGMNDKRRMIPQECVDFFFLNFPNHFIFPRRSICWHV